MSNDTLMSQCKSLVSRPYIEKVNKKILFLSIPRSGSTFLCDILTQHGGLGFPDEWLNPRFLEVFSKKVKPLTTPEALSKYCEFVMHKSATENGCFSLNMHVSSHLWWLTQGVNWIDEIAFDHIYFIYREDKYAQTYSWAIANKSLEWRKTSEGGKRQLPKDITFEFMFQLFGQLLRIEWNYETQIKPQVHRELKYEDFCQNIKGTVEQICNDAGVAFDPDRVRESKYKIQRTDYDQEMLAKFRAFMRSKLVNI